MKLAISTHWNACRHTDGQQLIREIIDAGFSRIEAGYDTSMLLLPGIRKMVEQQLVTVSSLHNFCPVPAGAPYGHPELFELASFNPRIRECAVTHTMRTIETAAELNARIVVTHAGNVRIRRTTPALIRMAQAGKQNAARYQRLKMRLMVGRAQKAPAQIELLKQSIETLMPALERHNVVLAIENLPSWEALPTEYEMEALLKTFNSPMIGYWHDIGHAQILHNLGFISHRHWLQRLAPWIKGMHLHDVAPPAYDHLMPGEGKLDFSLISGLMQTDIEFVMEPAPGTGTQAVINGRTFLANMPAAATGGKGAAEI